MCKQKVKVCVCVCVCVCVSVCVSVCEVSWCVEEKKKGGERRGGGKEREKMRESRHGQKDWRKRPKIKEKLHNQLSHLDSSPSPFQL